AVSDRRTAAVPNVAVVVISTHRRGCRCAGQRGCMMRRFVNAAIAVGLVALAACRESDAATYALTGGRASRGPALIRAYGCGACHTIPGVRGATAVVGPPLSGIASRSYVAGVIANHPENPVAWLPNC